MAKTNCHLHVHMYINVCAVNSTPELNEIIKSYFPGKASGLQEAGFIGLVMRLVTFMPVVYTPDLILLRSGT